MTLVAHFELELHHMDIKTAFLNDDIDECIYISQPSNYKCDDSK
jgi:Reverse transcriptase (RNA-dependent DNA polymerase)